jgi:hypothetical protein
LPLLLCMGCFLLKGGEVRGGGNFVKFWPEKYNFNLQRKKWPKFARFQKTENSRSPDF